MRNFDSSQQAVLTSDRAEVCRVQNGGSYPLLLTWVRAASQNTTAQIHKIKCVNSVPSLLKVCVKWSSIKEAPVNERAVNVSLYHSAGKWQRSCFSLTSVTFRWSCEGGERSDGRREDEERGKDKMEGGQTVISFLAQALTSFPPRRSLLTFLSFFFCHLLTSVLPYPDLISLLPLSPLHPPLLPFMPPSSPPVIPPPPALSTVSSSVFSPPLSLLSCLYCTFNRLPNPLSFSSLPVFSLSSPPLWFVINPLLCLHLSLEGFVRNPLITMCLQKPTSNLNLFYQTT